jgi:uncharacterized protein YacL (UPF0231 family)
MKIKLFRDYQNYPRAEASKSYRLLAVFLESEIQGDRRSGEEIVQIINKIKNKEIDHWEETGNASTLTLNLEKAIIDNEFTNETCEVSLDDFQQAVLDWIDLLEKT